MKSKKPPAKKPGRPTKRSKVGRPTVITSEVLSKLEEAFAFGCTDLEACLFAGISHESLYEYQRKNPEFTERKATLKETPILEARKTIIESLTDPDIAKWYLERKRKDEFSLRSEFTGKDGKDLPVPILANVDALHSNNSRKKTLLSQEKN